MNLNVVYKGLNKSPKIGEYTREKLTRKLNRLWFAPISVKILYTRERNLYVIKFHLLNSDGTRYDLEEKSTTLFEGINSTLEKFTRVANKRKKRFSKKNLRRLRVEEKVTPEESHEKSYQRSNEWKSLSTNTESDWKWTLEDDLSDGFSFPIEQSSFLSENATTNPVCP